MPSLIITSCPVQIVLRSARDDQSSTACTPCSTQPQGVHRVLSAERTTSFMKKRGSLKTGKASQCFF